jgi:GWxTD domain-containing protein
MLYCITRRSFCASQSSRLFCLSPLTSAVIALLFAAVFCTSVSAAEPKLAPGYREFLTGPTSLLLTRSEKAAFTQLRTDPERDTFIEHFWAVRNPTPGLAANEFKEEFYRRVAYANSFYGRDAGTNGWRTDRGRAYILFGKPQTSMNYHGNQELYATELWFYANPGLPELPPFFYVLFFEGDGVSGYHAYRPYVDGPQKLLRAGGMSPSQAYNYLRGISVELANATLSYIPGEPLDLQTFSGSMQSVQIVNAIQGFNEMPSYVARIAARAQHFERVTSKIEYKLATVNLLTFVVSQDGEPWVHWRMEVSDPAQKWAAGTATFEVHSKLYTQGRLVLEQQDKPEFPVKPEAVEQIAKRPIVYEDMIPVEAGRYQLAVELKNKATGAVYEDSREFEVHGKEETAVLGDVLVLEKHEPEPRRRPFQFGGVEFYPSAQNYVVPSRGLSILYQLQLPEKRAADLVAHYAIAEVTSNSKKTFDEKIDPQGADASGALLTSRTLPVGELSPGQYRLSVRIEDPASAKIAATALSFTVASEAPGKPPIVMARGQADTPQTRATIRYERALCLLALNRPAEAVIALRQSWELNNNSVVKALLEHLSSSSSGAAR